jgi:antibiotic biosynthesis monooxygenase (ABM) superfamily enzyme
MSEDSMTRPAARVGPPPKHHLALMIWLAVFPTLTVLQLLLGGLLAGAPMVLRTLVLATIAVPIITYGLMPALHRFRAYLIIRRDGMGGA